MWNIIYCIAIIGIIIDNPILLFVGPCCIFSFLLFVFGYAAAVDGEKASDVNYSKHIGGLVICGVVWIIFGGVSINLVKTPENDKYDTSTSIYSYGGYTHHYSSGNSHHHSSSGSSASGSSAYSSSTHSSNHHNCDPVDYDSPEDFADDAWGDDFDDWDDAYDYWDNY